jgi:mono/diheme cytochrome c family protein
MTYGINTMGSYASQLDREQRWKIAAYIKSMQPGGAKPAADTTSAAPATAKPATDSAAAKK